MPLQQTSGAASYDAFGGGAPVAAKYIEDFFQSWLRTGTGSSTTVTTGLNASINKSLVWTKSRSAATNHKLTDTARGVTKALSSNTTGAEVTDSQGLTAFSSTGYTIGTNTDYNNSGATYVDWQWVATPKFFDVVTFTSNGTGGATINHLLGSAPGCVIVKSTAATGNWFVYHRSLDPAEYLFLNTTAEAANGGRTVTTSSTQVTYPSGYLANSTTYVAYLFAHNAGGFGLSGTDNVISCGSFTTDGSGNATVNLGYEPQWVLTKRTDSTGNWAIVDSMRGNATLNGTAETERVLFPNTSAAEAGSHGYANPTSTGFQAASWGGVTTQIYIAIRRGPMKVPTTGTSVYQASYFGSGASGSPAYISGFPIDFAIHGGMIDGSTNKFATDRLRGTRNLFTNLTDSEGSNASNIFYQNGFYNGLGSALSNYFAWMFRRAPGFFDEVCYTGTGANRTVAHNLTVVPELMIVKSRTNGSASWGIYHAALGNSRVLNFDTGIGTSDVFFWNNTTPTASVFSVGIAAITNQSANNFVAYLFASAPGVSKVGSYTGNGSSQTINCGFTGGARFVMVKRTDSTGNWMVVDTARGLVSAGDPTLYLNGTGAEVTGVDWLDPDSSGFIVNQEGTMNANVNAATYIYLAIA